MKLFLPILLFPLLPNGMAKTDRDFLAAPLLLLPRHTRRLTPSGRLLLLPRPAPGARPHPSPAPRGRACSLLGGGHGGGARSWQEMEEPPSRFFSDIFPENHADLSWVPDR